MTDSEINLVLNETLGFSQKLSHDDAQLLLDKLIEFQHKEGSTDVSLNHFRGLAVESTGNSIRFAFFQRDQASHTLHWHNLKQQEIQSAITNSEMVLARCKRNNVRTLAGPMAPHGIAL